MNVISQIRQEVKRNGNAVISIDQFNKLQAEWVKRANPGFSSLEALRDLIVRDIAEGSASPEMEDAVNKCYDYVYESITRTLLS